MIVSCSPNILNIVVEQQPCNIPSDHQRAQDTIQHTAEQDSSSPPFTNTIKEQREANETRENRSNFCAYSKIVNKLTQLQTNR